MEILKIHTKKKPLDKDVDLNKLAEMTEGYTGADLAAMANAAAMVAIKEYVAKNGKAAEEESANVTITMRQFEQAVEKIKGNKRMM